MQRAAAGLATPTGPLSTAAPSSATASEPVSPSKPASEAGSTASSEIAVELSSPVPVLSVSKVAGQASRACSADCLVRQAALRSAPVRTFQVAALLPSW